MPGPAQEAGWKIHDVTPIGGDAGQEEIVAKAGSFALAAWFEIIEGHQIVVPVLVIEDGDKREIIRDIGKIWDEIDDCIAKKIAGGGQP